MIRSPSEGLDSLRGTDAFVVIASVVGICMVLVRTGTGIVVRLLVVDARAASARSCAKIVELALHSCDALDSLFSSLRNDPLLIGVTALMCGAVTWPNKDFSLSQGGASSGAVRGLWLLLLSAGGDVDAHVSASLLTLSLLSEESHTYVLADELLAVVSNCAPAAEPNSTNGEV